MQYLVLMEEFKAICTDSTKPLPLADVDPIMEAEVEKGTRNLNDSKICKGSWDLSTLSLYVL